MGQVLGTMLTRSATRVKQRPVTTSDIETSGVFDVYYNPRAPHSFGGASGLHRVLEGKKSRREVKKWLSTQKTYTLHKPVRKKFKRNVIMVSEKDEQFQADLADVSSLAAYNNGINYILTCVDVFTKYAWAIPMRDKSARSTVQAFRQIFAERKPLKLQTDFGKEFDNAVVREFMKSVGVLHFYAYNTEIKASIAERYNRTLKDRMFRLMTYRDSFRYIDDLPDLVYSYNNSYHIAIKMTPAQASLPGRRNEVWKNLYGSVVNKLTSVKRFKYKLGDYVRISQYRDVFRKGYRSGWSKEVFVVVKQSPRDKVVYHLKDLQGEEVIGSFYEEELQKVPKPEQKEIDEILKERSSGRRERDLEYFVKFRNIPASKFVQS